MARLELAPAFDVVPADAVQAIVRAWGHEVAALRAELDSIADEARALEAEAGRSSVIAPEQREEIERRLVALLDDWLRREEQELPAAIEAARVRAEDRVRLAKVEAGAITAAARTDVEREAASLPAGLDGSQAAPPLIVPPAGLVAAPPAPRSPLATSDVDDVLAALLAALEGSAPLPGPGSELLPTEQDIEAPAVDAAPAPELPAAGPTEHQQFWEGEAAAGQERGRRRRLVLVDFLLPVLGLLVLVIIGLLLIG